MVVVKLEVRKKSKKVTSGIVAVIDLSESVSIDLNAVYRFLKCIYDSGKALNVSEVVRCGFSYTTASKYAAILEEYGLITVRVKGREKEMTVTEKGIEFLMLYSRILSIFKK